MDSKRPLERPIDVALTPLLDQFSCLEQQRTRNVYAQKLCRLQIYGQSKSSGLLDREVGGLRATKYPIDVLSHALPHVIHRFVGGESTVSSKAANEA